MLLDKLAEEGQVGKVEFVADLLDRLVGVAQLLTNSANSGSLGQGTTRQDCCRERNSPVSRWSPHC